MAEIRIFIETQFSNLVYSIRPDDVDLLICTVPDNWLYEETELTSHALIGTRLTATDLADSVGKHLHHAVLRITQDPIAIDRLIREDAEGLNTEKFADGIQQFIKELAANPGVNYCVGFLFYVPKVPKHI